MRTSVGLGSYAAIAYAAIAYGKRWYVAKVTDVQDGVFGVSYTTPCRGKWKWGMADEGEASHKTHRPHIKVEKDAEEEED